MYTFDHTLIRVFRETEQISQSELARAVRRSRAAVQQWESGMNMPTIPTLVDLCAALDVEPGVFFLEKPTKGERQCQQNL